MEGTSSTLRDMRNIFHCSFQNHVNENGVGNYAFATFSITGFTTSNFAVIFCHHNWNVLAFHVLPCTQLTHPPQNMTIECRPHITMVPLYPYSGWEVMVVLVGCLPSRENSKKCCLSSDIEVGHFEFSVVSCWRWRFFVLRFELTVHTYLTF